METENYATSEEYEQLAAGIIEEHEELHWIRDNGVRIGYVASAKDKHTKERYVYGECIKIKEIYQLYMPYDFLIIFYEPNISNLDEEQKKILMFHELLHVGISVDGSEYEIVPHDIEDFSLIIERYGLKWGDKK